MDKTKFLEFGQRWIRSRVGVIIDPESDLMSDGTLDSLTFNELLSALEAEFSIKFDFDHLPDWSAVFSLAGLAESVEKITSESGLG